MRAKQPKIICSSASFLFFFSLLSLRRCRPRRAPSLPSTLERESSSIQEHQRRARAFEKKQQQETAEEEKDVEDEQEAR